MKVTQIACIVALYGILSFGVIWISHWPFGSPKTFTFGFPYIYCTNRGLVCRYTLFRY
jgi:hypothetical protein